MESDKKYREPDTVWVKIWIGLGVAAIGFGVLFLLILAVYGQAELERKQDCDDGIRNDCEPSLLWLLQGVEMSAIAPEGEDQDDLKMEADRKIEEQYERGVRLYVTGQGAPSVSGVDMRGTDYDENWFSADAGTEIEVVVRPEGDFERVDLYVHPKVTPTPGVGIYEGAFSDQGDGTYLAVYRLPVNLEADLEARVSGEGDSYGSAFIQIRSR